MYDPISSTYLRMLANASIPSECIATGIACIDEYFRRYGAQSLAQCNFDSSTTLTPASTANLDRRYRPFEAVNNPVEPLINRQGEKSTHYDGPTFAHYLDWNESHGKKGCFSSYYSNDSDEDNMPSTPEEGPILTCNPSDTIMQYSAQDRASDSDCSDWISSQSEESEEKSSDEEEEEGSQSGSEYSVGEDDDDVYVDYNIPDSIIDFSHIPDSVHTSSSPSVQSSPRKRACTPGFELVPSKRRKLEYLSSEREYNNESSQTNQPFEKIQLKDGTFKYRCLTCPDFTTRASGDMRRHMESLVHKPQKANICECGASFTRIDALKRHRRTKQHRVEAETSVSPRRRKMKTSNSA